MPLCGGCFEGVTEPPSKSPSKEVRRTMTKKNEFFEQVLEYISHVPLFQQIPLDRLPSLAKAFHEEDYNDGEDIIKQGQIGEEFFVIKTGEAVVVVDGVEVSTLGKGDFFGEGSMLHGAPRRATVTASGGSVQCLALTRQSFNDLQLRKLLNFKLRKGVVIQDAPDSYRFVPPKTREEKEFIQKAFISDPFIADYVKNCKVLSSVFNEITEKAFPEKVARHTVLMTQGDTKADFFYMLESGTAEVFKDGEKIASYKDGGSFGAHALVLQTPRAVTVKITSDSKVWCIGRSCLRHVLKQELQAKVAAYKKVLAKVDLFDDWSEEEKEFMADALMETTYTKGQLVTKQGEDCKAFFVLEAGEVSEVEHGGEHSTIKVEGTSCEHLPYFGERAVLEDHAYFCTRTVLSEKATFLVLRRDVCQRVLQRHSSDAAHHQDRVEYSMSELSTKGLLGCGGFGKVTLERHEPSGQLFALKKLSKGFLVQQHQQKQVMNEKRILRMCNSQFLIQGAATFNSDQYLYFLMEPALGGELLHIYAVNDFHGRADLAQFYSACVIKGFEHLHERSIIYRDMKQDNLVLDAMGYCKITDFGLAKFCIGKTFTICGTPEFFAPEMIKSLGHNTSLDWWTLGILIYELMMGAVPFEAFDMAGLIPKILKGVAACPAMPRTRSWAHLVKELCKDQPCERLPVKPGGVKNLEDHAWYKESHFDFDALVYRQMPAPFTPKKAKGTDNFVADQEDPEETPYTDTGDGWDEDFEDPCGPRTFFIAPPATKRSPSKNQPEQQGEQAENEVQQQAGVQDGDSKLLAESNRPVDPSGARLKKDSLVRMVSSELHFDLDSWSKAVGA